MPDHRTPCPGLVRCLGAMTRAKKRVMKTARGTEHEILCLAGLKGVEAFREAMPPLTSPENVRDFIACFTFGLLNDIFSNWEAPAFLSAARAAMGVFRAQRQAQEQLSAEKNQN